ncbi:hypothetical protein [Empedobacter tilapiae]|nr:hypothetical protein [Empedobacter tilapiae]
MENPNGDLSINSLSNLSEAHLVGNHANTWPYSYPSQNGTLFTKQ